MAIQPIQPQKKDTLGKLFTVGGAVAGGLLGGPQGAAMGAGLGQTAGNVLSQNAPPPSVESQGMTRRIDTIQQNPMVALQEANSALQGLPQDQFPEARKAFQDALALSKRNQQLGAV